MTHSDATRIAEQKYPIYLEDDPEKGIKKHCRLDILRIEGKREQLIKKLMQQENGKGETL